MLSTVFTVVLTHNLAIGVLVGCLLAALFFVHKIGNIMRVESTLNSCDTQRTYQVNGQVFFASAHDFSLAFDTTEPLESVTIDLSHAHFWDISAVSALDKIIIKFRHTGAKVNIIGMNEACSSVINRFAIHDNPKEVTSLFAGH